MSSEDPVGASNPSARDAQSYLVFEPERACPLCGSVAHQVLSRRMQHGLNCRTVICKACAFCFVSPAPTRVAYDAFYRDAYAGYYGSIHPPLVADSVVESGEEAERFRAIERHQPLQRARLLEVGAGNGRFLLLASRRGAICHAIEPSQAFRVRLEALGVRPVGEFLETTAVDQPYDVVALFQVLEHFHDPATALRAVLGQMGDNGILVLDVPNIWKPYRSLDGHFLRYPHLSYFSPASLVRLLGAHDLEVLHIDTAEGRSLHYPRPIFAIAKKRKNGDLGREGLARDDWKTLARFLRRYRLAYPVLVAPRMAGRLWLKRIRRWLSN